jgi:ribosomal protein S27E
VLFHHFERFVAEYESRFEREYGYFRPIIKDVVEKYLDCGNPRCGFARIRCPSCRAEHLVMFSCKTRGFCPSCHAKRLEEWGEWVQEMMDYLKFIGRVTSHIPDKGQVTVRYYGLYANAHRGKVRKTGLSPFLLRMAEEEVRRIPSKGWAEMIRKVYEVDPMLCPKCGGSMEIIAFITDYPAVDRIIDHLKFGVVAEKPPPSHVFEQVALMAAEEGSDYF